MFERAGALEVLLVDGVHFLELRHIVQIDLNRNDIGVVHLGVVQNVPDIFQAVSDLLAEVAWQCMGFRVRSLQTRDVQGIASQDSRTVGRANGDEFTPTGVLPDFVDAEKSNSEAASKQPINFPIGVFSFPR